MKKTLSILLVSICCFVGAQDRVLISQLNQGDLMYNFHIVYHKGELFSGIGYNVYSNGQLWMEVNYKDGKYNGLLKEWDDKGQLKLEENYKNGEKNGAQRYYWYSSSQLYDESNWKHGKLDGSWKTWYENGQLEREENYILDRMISETCWNESGEKIKCSDLE